jgi:hypothetical protein
VRSQFSLARPRVVLTPTTNDAPFETEYELKRSQNFDLLNPVTSIASVNARSRPQTTLFSLFQVISAFSMCFLVTWRARKHMPSSNRVPFPRSAARFSKLTVYLLPIMECNVGFPSFGLWTLMLAHWRRFSPDFACPYASFLFVAIFAKLSFRKNNESVMDIKKTKKSRLVTPKFRCC